MNKVLFIKSDHYCNVRVQKYIEVLKDFHVIFVGWEREPCEGFLKPNEIINLNHGGGFGFSTKLIFGYVKFLLRLFFFILTKEKISSHKIIAINFDVACVLYFASFFRRFHFIYEIHDTFSLSYNLPIIASKLIDFVDIKIRNNCCKVIHVDINRVSEKENNYIIIENSPLDYIQKKQINI